MQVHDRSPMVINKAQNSKWLKQNWLRGWGGAVRHFEANPAFGYAFETAKKCRRFEPQKGEVSICRAGKGSCCDLIPCCKIS